MKAKQNRRMFRRNRRRRATLATAFAVVVAGCAQTVADWSPAQTNNELQVQWITHEHSVNFANPASGLTRQEMRGLDRFLSEIELRPSDRLFVDVGPQSGEVVSDSRVGVINDQLRIYVPGAHAMAITGEKGTNRQIRLIVGRYVVLPPNCPDLSRPSNNNTGNHNDSNFGCSTQRNLGLMVADPGDLIRGRTLGPADAEMLTKTFRESRAGEVQLPHISSKHLRR